MTGKCRTTKIGRPEGGKWRTGFGVKSEGGTYQFIRTVCSLHS